MRKKELKVLKEKISDLEGSLSELKRRLKQNERNAQHEAIDNLEFYLEQVDRKYVNLRSFWAILAAELRMLFRRFSDDDPGGSG